MSWDEVRRVAGRRASKGVVLWVVPFSWLRLLLDMSKRLIVKGGWWAGLRCKSVILLDAVNMDAFLQFVPFLVHYLRFWFVASAEEDLHQAAINPSPSLRNP